jgi:hypothetical protein
MPPSPPFLEHLYTVKVKERRWAAINIITVYTTTVSLSLYPMFLKLLCSSSDASMISAHHME